jgi:signal-transduction protein with cAMP-binding, CBS, and nucleotidyltransferase domain
MHLGPGLSLSQIPPALNWGTMKTVREILAGKGSFIWSIQPDATVFEALQTMSDNDVGALIVLDGETVAGVLSERDYARKVILHGRSSKELMVKEIMSAKVYFVKPEQNIEDCMALFTNKRVRHLPVLENDKLRGIISIGDVVKAVIAEHEFTIKHLENYITGGLS